MIQGEKGAPADRLALQTPRTWGTESIFPGSGVLLHQLPPITGLLPRSSFSSTSIPLRTWTRCAPRQGKTSELLLQRKALKVYRSGGCRGNSRVPTMAPLKATFNHGPSSFCSAASFWGGTAWQHSSYCSGQPKDRHFGIDGA